MLADAVGVVEDGGGEGAGDGAGDAAAAPASSAATSPLPPPGDGDDAWRTMMRSDFHFEFAQRNRTVHAHLGAELERAPSTSAAARAGSAADAAASGAQARRASSGVFRAELPALFLAWHALYEDLKLARLEWCHLLPLARLLSALLRSWGGEFLLCTVTFYANLAHNLTRSP